MDPKTADFLQAEATRAAEELGVKLDDQPQPPAPTPEPQAPVVEAPVVEQPAQPVSAPQPQDEPAPQATPEPQAPVAPVVQAEEEDDTPEIPTFAPYTYQYPQQLQQQQPVQPVPQQVQPQQPQAAPVQSQQLPQLDPSQFTDSYGNVDMGRFTQAMRARDEALVNQVTSNLTTRFTTDFSSLAQQAAQRAEQVATQQIMAAETERRAWERTFAKFPQVRENKDLRDQIHKMRIGEVAVTGKPVSPVRMAERYFSQIAQAREDGVRQAVETTKVQATAHLETSNNTASDKAQEQQRNWSQIADRDRKVSTDARTSLLKQMLADGKL